MKFEIDVSGYDIFNDKKYVICIASDSDKRYIKWFKLEKDLINKIKSNWKQGNYRYGLSNKQRGFLKVRLYCIIIYYLFKSIKEDLGGIELTICKDFSGHKNDINENLKYFLERLLKIKIKPPISHRRLPKTSNAHRYAYLIYKDEYNLFNYEIKIKLEDIEKYLKK